MSDKPGIEKPGLHALPVMRDRLSFLYLERCKINRQDGAVTITDVRGTVHVPAAQIGVLLLGPGTEISHRAMELIGDSGASIVWVGEHGVRYYAHGKPLTHSATLLIRQAELVSNTRGRLAVAREMYKMRFPDEDVSELTMQQLRGREGARVRGVYRHYSKRWGVPWSGREYEADDYASGTEINKAISAGNACLYGLCHSVIVALGLSPGLGFIHTGHERSFVYDIADLYKAELIIPVAFEMASKPREDIGADTRRSVRDLISDGHMLERCTMDIRRLLLGTDGADSEDFAASIVHLWDNKLGELKSGVSYAPRDEEVEEEAGEGYGRLFFESAEGSEEEEVEET
ncbi:MAG: type I-E CRISPR-associated endonuclease Cas1e [Cystobacterineae bacterium]|nr:type I-E CRISPR-associated endonuclease Cas1e [Cystobacterineae bacterium]